MEEKPIGQVSSTIINHLFLPPMSLVEVIWLKGKQMWQSIFQRTPLPRYFKYAHNLVPFHVCSCSGKCLEVILIQVGGRFSFLPDPFGRWPQAILSKSYRCMNWAIVRSVICSVVTSWQRNTRHTIYRGWSALKFTGGRKIILILYSRSRE